MSEKTSTHESEKPTLTIEPHPAYPDGGQIYVTTTKRKYQQHPGNIQKMRDEGLSDQEIAERLDAEDDRIQAQIREKNAEMWRQMDEDDYDGTDPLAGDVDPTGGYYEEPQHPWDAHMDRVHKEHGN